LGLRFFRIESAVCLFIPLDDFGDEYCFRVPINPVDHSIGTKPRMLKVAVASQWNGIAPKLAVAKIVD
jgi:hypothetical protein